MLSKAQFKIKRFVHRNSSTILAVVGAAGVIGTTVLTIKATVKAEQLLREAEEEGIELTTTDKILYVGECYIPTILVGGGTILTIFALKHIDERKQASLMSAYSLLSNSFSNYRNKVAELYGQEVASEIDTELAKDNYDGRVPAKDKVLFYDRVSERYFESTMEDVLRAEYHFNRNFILRGYANVNEFYEFLNIDSMDFGDYIGWSIEAGSCFYGYNWVDFYHSKMILEDGLECYSIEMPFRPTADYLLDFDDFSCYDSSQING